MLGAARASKLGESTWTSTKAIDKLSSPADNCGMQCTNNQTLWTSSQWNIVHRSRASVSSARSFHTNSGSMLSSSSSAKSSSSSGGSNSFGTSMSDCENNETNMNRKRNTMQNASKRHSPSSLRQSCAHSSSITSRNWLWSAIARYEVSFDHTQREGQPWIHLNNLPLTLTDMCLLPRASVVCLCFAGEMGKCQSQNCNPCPKKVSYPPSVLRKILLRH